MRKRLKKKKNVASNNEHRSINRKRGRQLNKASRLASSTTRPVQPVQPVQPLQPVQLSIQEKLGQHASQLAEIVDIVNKRVNDLFNNGLYSLALDKLTGGDDYYCARIDDIETEGGAIERLTQFRTFLADSGSTIDGARLQMAEINREEYKGMFGNNWRFKANNWKSYNTQEIDKELFEEACRVYRKIEEDRAMEIYNDGGYGSENFISLLYSYMVQYKDADMSHILAVDVLDAFNRENNPMNRDNELEHAETDRMVSITGTEIDNITGRRNF